MVLSIKVEFFSRWKDSESGYRSLGCNSITGGTAREIYLRIENLMKEYRATKALVKDINSGTPLFEITRMSGQGLLKGFYKR